jgi:hypothetical protein
LQNGQLLAQSQVLGDQGGAIEQYGTKAAAEELEVVHPPILGTTGCLASRRRRILAIPLSVAAAMAFAAPTGSQLISSRAHSALFKSDLPASSSNGADGPLAAEESLILDARSGLSPAQMVEAKLVSLLRAKGSLVSHIQMAGLLKARG